MTELNSEDQMRLLLQAPAANAPSIRSSHRARPGCERIALPSGAPAALPLGFALGRRAAARVYRPEAVDLAAVSAVLAASSPHASEDDSGSVAPKLHVHAWQIRELKAAYYRYDPQSHSLIEVADTLGPAHRGAMLRQLEFASAAALLVAIGDLAT